MLNIVSAIIVISIVTPWFLLPCAVLLFLYFFLLRLYLMSARDVKRIIDVMRGPLIGRYTEANNGLTVIRSFKKMDYFLSFFDRTVNEHTRACFHEAWGQRWIGMITETTAALLIGACALFGVISKNQNNNQVSAYIGLSITWALQLASYLPSTIQVLANLEVNMNSVYRILDYTDHVPQEKPYYKPEQPKNWPSAG